MHPQALRNEGAIYMVFSSETQDYVLYPVDEKTDFRVDDEVVQLWRDTPVPADPAELEEDLRKAGAAYPLPDMKSIGFLAGHRMAKMNM